MNYSISATLIVKNEERNLSACLKSIQALADEIIIVDTGSEDRTIEIAKQFTQHIFHFDWCDDYSKARNEALKYATKKWVLIINADETLDPQSLKKIPRYLSQFPTDPIYLLLFRLLTPGQPNLFVRGLFPNHQGISFKGRVHEFPTHSTQELIGIECPDIVLHHSPLYPTDKYDYDKRLLLADLKELKKPYERAVHLFHLGRTEIKRQAFSLALEALEQALIQFYLSGAEWERRLHHNLLQLITEISIEQELYEKGFKHAERLYTLFPDFIQSQLYLGNCAFYLNNLGTASFHYKNLFRELHRSSLPESLKNQFFFSLRLGLARISLLNEDFQTGITSLHSLYQENPNHLLAAHLSRAYLLSQNEGLAQYWLSQSGEKCVDLVTDLQKKVWWSEKEVLQLSHYLGESIY